VLRTVLQRASLCKSRVSVYRVEVDEGDGDGDGGSSSADDSGGDYGGDRSGGESSGDGDGEGEGGLDGEEAEWLQRRTACAASGSASASAQAGGLSNGRSTPAGQKKPRCAQR
jgi:hypothetical protein